MSTTTLEQAGVPRLAREAADELRVLHFAAAEIAAELDLDDTNLWRDADAVVAGLSAAAYETAAALVGEAQPAVVAAAPPVVRVRELASAQRRLFAALHRHWTDERSELVGEVADRVRTLGEMLAHVSRSAQVRRALPRG